MDMQDKLKEIEYLLSEFNSRELEKEKRSLIKRLYKKGVIYNGK